MEKARPVSGADGLWTFHQEHPHPVSLSDICICWRWNYFCYPCWSGDGTGYKYQGKAYNLD